MAEPKKLVAEVIEAAGGKITGRIRLQKIFYLLDQSGLESGFNYHYHHYGPFSRDLDEAVSNAQAFEGVREVIQYRQADGMPYSVFSIEPAREGLTPPLGKLDPDRARELLATMTAPSSTVLELAATIHWLSEKERVTDWRAELIRRKGPKTERGRMDQAFRLLGQLGLPPAIPDVA